MLNPRVNRRALSPRAILATAVVVAAFVLPAAALRAVQGGPLSGSIYDPTGAVLPGVAVVLKDADGTEWNATSNASGRFEFPGVAPGAYLLTASLPGFKSLRQDVTLARAADWDRVITLQVGQVQETITVSASRVVATSPQPGGSPQRPIRVGGNIRAPRKELDVKPIYPAAMRAAGREGVVPIEALIGVDGTVTSVRVVSAQVHPDFAIAAADAVRQWKFTPTLLNGAPVEVVMSVTVTFKLAD
jgi:TonB family protein